MKDTYRTVFKDNEILFKEKGSKFISKIYHVERKDEIDQIVSALKKEHYTANHHCTAYVIDDKTYHYNDDGEPSNTAGKPIYDMISGAGLIQVLIVVIRYFGGTKLGTGGLIRAYGTSAKLVIEQADIEEVIIREHVQFTYTYDETNIVMHCIQQFDIKILDQAYGDYVDIKLDIRKSEVDAFTKKIFEASNGQINPCG